MNVRKLEREREEVLLDESLEVVYGLQLQTEGGVSEDRVNKKDLRFIRFKDTSKNPRISLSVGPMHFLIDGLAQFTLVVLPDLIRCKYNKFI